MSGGHICKKKVIKSKRQQDRELLLSLFLYLSQAGICSSATSPVKAGRGPCSIETFIYFPCCPFLRIVCNKGDMLLRKGSNNEKVKKKTFEMHPHFRSEMGGRRLTVANNINMVWRSVCFRQRLINC